MLALRAELGSADLTLRHWRARGHLRVFGLLPGAGRPGLRHLDDGGRGRAAGRRRRARRALRGHPPRGRDRAEPVAGLPADRSRHVRRAVRLDVCRVRTRRASASATRASAPRANRSASASSPTSTWSTSTCRTASRAARTSRCSRSATPTTRPPVPSSRGTPSTATTFNQQRTRVFVLTGSGFRAPDATDRLGFGGNPDLEPGALAELRDRRASCADARGRRSSCRRSTPRSRT